MYFCDSNRFVDVLAVEIRVCSRGIGASDVCTRDVVNVLLDSDREARSDG